MEGTLSAAVEKAYSGILKELAGHGVRTRRTIQVPLPRIAEELGMDWRSPEFARLVERAIDETGYSAFSSGEAQNNIYITVAGSFNKVAVAGLLREPR